MKPSIVLLAWSGAVFGAEVPGDFAYAVPVRTEAGAAFHQVTLPPPVYEGAVRSDLGDMRVFNGAGEVVPHAFQVRSVAAPQAQARLAAPLFALHAQPLNGAQGAGVRIQTRADGTIIMVEPGSASRAPGAPLVAYIADVSAHKGSISALELERPADAGPFVGKLTVEGSDDLSGWRVLVDEAPVLSLTAGAAQLQRLRVEFPAQPAKYLRLSWPSSTSPIELAALTVEPASARPEPQRHWKAVTARQDKAHEYIVEPAGQFPVDRLRVQLPQPNTVAPVAILASGKPGESWQPLVRTVVYRLHSDRGEVTSPDIAVLPVPGRRLLLRFDGQGDGIGMGTPGVEIGWVPHELVFAARGAAPFQIAYGSAKAQYAAYPIESLIPGYRRPPEPPAIPIVSASTGEPFTHAGAPALRQPLDIKRWTLWGSLLLGVAALGAMAWRLSRQMAAQAGQTTADHADPERPPAG